MKIRRSAAEFLLRTVFHPVIVPLDYLEHVPSVHTSEACQSFRWQMQNCRVLDCTALSFLLQLLSVANCFSGPRASVDSSSEKATALCTSANHSNPNKAAFTQHSFFQEMNSLQCLSCPWSLSSASKWLCVCMCVYMCLPFTVILVKICNYSYINCSNACFSGNQSCFDFFLPTFACIFILVCVNYQYNSKLHNPIMQYQYLVGHWEYSSQSVKLNMQFSSHIYRIINLVFKMVENFICVPIEAESISTPNFSQFLLFLFYNSPSLLHVFFLITH